MARLTVKTKDGDLYVYDKCVAGNLSSGYLVVCGEDGPAYLGTGGFLPLQAHLFSRQYGQGSHWAIVIAEGRVLTLPSGPQIVFRTPEWKSEPRSMSVVNPVLASIVQRKINGEDIGHPLTYYARHLGGRAAKHLKERQRKRGMNG